MRARRLMTRDVQCVLPETLVSHAWSLMHVLCVRHLPVTQEGNLVGLVSDRDLLTRAVHVRDGVIVFSPDSVIGQVMTLNPVVCTQGATIAEIARLIVKHQIDSIPIVADDGRLVGLVTSTDLVALLMDKSRQLPFTFHVSGPSASA